MWRVQHSRLKLVDVFPTRIQNYWVEEEEETFMKSEICDSHPILTFDARNATERSMDQWPYCGNINTGMKLTSFAA